MSRCEPDEGKESRGQGKHLKQRVGQEASTWSNRRPVWPLWWRVAERE